MLGLFKSSKTAATEAVPDKPADAPVGASSENGRSGWLARLKTGLSRTGNRLTALLGARRIDEALFEELETALLSSDAGVQASTELIGTLRRRARDEGLQTAEQLRAVLASLLVDRLAPLETTIDPRQHRPFVIMLAGVNGAGKTTSIGKLAKLFQAQGLSVLLAAGDTFRAAAREQLGAWGERNGVTVISQSGGDPAAVVFDAIQAARARGVDVVLADTAGRLPTQGHLMEELKKVRRVIAKADASAPHAVWLVLDGNTGQNGLAQLRAFDDAVGLTGIILTKLDGTARGGVVVAAAGMPRAPGSDARPVPVVFIGVGEGIDDLRPFRAREFVDALLG